MQNNEREITPPIKRTQKLELDKNFKHVKILGEGAFGAVELYKYIGKDKKIKKLCNERGEIGVKFQNTIDMNEAIIGNHLLNHVLTHPPSHPINLVTPFNEDDKTVAILTKPVFYEEDSNANLEDFIVKILPIINEKTINNPWFNAFSFGLAITLAQLVNEMFKGQESLHTANVLHLDTACRNFLMAPPDIDNYGNLVKLNLIISDYGLSGIMEENNIVNTESIAEKAPLRFYDQNAIAERSATVSTDFFSLKTTITEMLGFTAGGTSNVEFIKYPNIGIIPGRFLANSPYAKDNKALKIYSENVEGMIQNHPKDFQDELKIFNKCYKKFAIKLDNKYISNLAAKISTLSENLANLSENEMLQAENEILQTRKELHKAKREMHHESLLKCNSKFVKEMIKLKSEFLKNIDNLEYSQYNQLPEKELLVKRLLSLEVTNSFKASNYYKRLVVLHQKCQLLNEQHFTVLFKSNPINVEQFNNLDLAQRQAQIAFIQKLSNLDVSEQFRKGHSKSQPQDKTFEEFKQYQSQLQKSNAEFIKNNLKFTRDIVINIDKTDKASIKNELNKVNHFLKFDLKSDFYKTETAQKLQKYQKRFEIVLNEHNIKEHLESKLPSISKLDEKRLAENAKIVCHLLSIQVRKRFLETNIYQSLLNYQKAIMLKYVDTHYTNLIEKLAANTVFTDPKQSAFYKVQKASYEKALTLIKNDFDNGDYPNIRQIQKVLQPIDKAINNEITTRRAQKEAVEKLLLEYKEFKDDLLNELKHHKWVFYVDKENNSKDPYIKALMEFRQKLEEFPEKIKKREITQLADIKKSVEDSLKDINIKKEDRQLSMQSTKNLHLKNSSEPPKLDSPPPSHTIRKTF